VCGRSTRLGKDQKGIIFRPMMGGTITCLSGEYHGKKDKKRQSVMTVTKPYSNLQRFSGAVYIRTLMPTVDKKPCVATCDIHHGDF
jgi:hypothetical protein